MPKNLKGLRQPIKRILSKSSNYNSPSSGLQSKSGSSKKIIIGIVIIISIGLLILVLILAYLFNRPKSITNLNIFKPVKKNTKDNDFLNIEKSRLTLDLIESNQGQCFGIGGAQQITTLETCEKAGGTWDTPCQTDTDCPYYETNKNYLNRRGTCKNGYCELPIGCDSKFRTFRTCGTQDKPQCYNCKEGFEGFGSMGECCEEQESFTALDTSVNCEFDDIYKCLKSADYSYPGDLNDRRKKQFRQGLTSERKR
jgi:hypothetical protein